MTRGKWVALAVGLAVGAVGVVRAPELWRAVAYVDERHDHVLVVKSREPSHGVPRRNPDYMTITRKRFSWLPGQSYVHCSWCVESTHEQCLGDEFVFLPKESLSLPARTCTCLHPSHGEESE